MFAFLIVWAKHALLNVGCLVEDTRKLRPYKAIESLWHIFLPPQVDHPVQDCQDMLRTPWRQAFHEAWNIAKS